MTIRDRYLGVVDRWRGRLASVYDLRRFDVVVRVNTWTSGLLPGSQGSTKVTVDTPLVVAGGQRPKVEQVSQRAIFASGGLYTDQDLRIGPITPRSGVYVAGVDPVTFDPATAGTNIEVLFKVTGPGYTSGAWFKKIGSDVTGNFGHYVIVRKTGETQ